jgi:hypothetical protein
MPPEPVGDPADPVENPTGIREPEEIEQDPDGNVINPPIEDPETETEDGIGRDRQRPDRGIED